METLVLVVGLMLAAVLLVGVGDRLRLPWPALMLLLGVGMAFVPGLPDRFDLEPELILPLFLPPLLFATAQRTSWALFRARWRSIAFLAVGLVVATATAVAGTVAVLVPGIGISAAIALGAMVAPPDPGFTLPFLVRWLGVATDADTEHAAEQAIMQRARAAAMAVLTADDRVDRLPRTSARACGSGWTASTACCAATRRRPRTASAPRPCAATVRSCPPCRPRPSPPPAPRC